MGIICEIPKNIFEFNRSVDGYPNIRICIAKNCHNCPVAVGNLLNNEALFANVPIKDENGKVISYSYEYQTSRDPEKKQISITYHPGFKPEALWRSSITAGVLSRKEVQSS